LQISSRLHRAGTIDQEWQSIHSSNLPCAESSQNSFEWKKEEDMFENQSCSNYTFPEVCHTRCDSAYQLNSMLTLQQTAKLIRFLSYVRSGLAADLDVEVPARCKLLKDCVLQHRMCGVCADVGTDLNKGVVQDGESQLPHNREEPPPDIRIVSCGKELCHKTCVQLLSA